MNNFRKKFWQLLLGILVIFFVSANSIYAQNKNLSDYSIVQNFIAKMVAQYNFDQKYLEKLFNHTELSQEVINKIKNPYEEQPWYIYKRNFLTKQRIAEGVKYWQNHFAALSYAEKKYGVPASIITAIVGVESLYGKVELKYPVLNSLTTLSFCYPERAKFFTHELEEYLLLTRELNVNPKSIKGSYAGAIGLPQFMPSNYRAFAISIQNSNIRGDLIHDTDDVIISVANFLNYFGWEENGPIAIPAKVQGKKYKHLLTNSLEPKYLISKFSKYNVLPLQKVSKYQKATLLQFEKNSYSYEYWLGFNNFYVLANYNNSDQYILAVYLLAQEIEHQFAVN